MESSRRLIIMLVVGIVLVFGIIALRSMRGGEQAVPETPPLRILVAKRDIPHGSVLQPLQDLDWMVVPPEELKEDYLREDAVKPEQFNGAIVRRQLRVGEPVTAAMITRAGEGGFMSAVLEPGMRAVSIGVSPTSGNAGFVSPGDRVDLIVTHRVQTDGSTNKVTGTVVSQTFVRNLRVIAVDQLLENPDNQAILAKTVTVEVTPRQAEEIAVASDLGKISIVLRSLSEPEPKEVAEGTVAGAPTHKDGRGYTSDSDVSGALDIGGISSTIRIIRGDQIENMPRH